MNVPPDFGISDSDLTEVVVPNDLKSARESEDEILSLVDRCSFDPDTVFAIKLSLEEALTNAVKHGNQNDPAKQLGIKYHIAKDRVVLMVRDEGSGFIPDTVPDPTADENLERPSGRGLMLMQSYMTKIAFNERGNEVWMLKVI